MNTTNSLSGNLSPQIPASPFPEILIAGDDARAAEAYRQRLVDAGFTVWLNVGYRSIEALWMRRRCPVVLLDVPDIHAVEGAVQAALAIKRHDPGQFIGYLADPILRTSGLAGDAVFPRHATLLPEAVRAYFTRQDHQG